MELPYKKVLRDTRRGPTIPHERGNVAQWVLVIISSCILLFGSYLAAANLLLYLALNINVLLIILFGEILYRFCLICEEQKHFTSRYNNHYSELFSDAFSFAKVFVIIFVVSIVGFISNENYRNPLDVISEVESGPIICSFIGITLLSRLFKLDSGPLYESIYLLKLNGLDYGSSMAYSFFHGFLKIVLPHIDTERRGIKELIMDFESSQDVKFACYKLLVLIPLSLYCPTSVAEKSRLVKEVKSLGEIKLTRAGVRERIYKNTVYAITNPINKKDKNYFCVEYATPLQTLYEIVSDNNQHAEHYKKHSRELVLHFYKTLKRILKNSPACNDNCELIFYEDKISAGEYIDVGEVILAHLKHMKKKEEKRYLTKLKSSENKHL